MHPQHTHIQSNTGKLCLLPPAKSQSMTKLDLTMVSMCSKSPGRAMTTFAIHSSQQPLVCAETTWVSRCFPLAPSVDKAVILTRDIPTTSGTRVASETQMVRWQEQRRDIHGFWDQTGRTLMRMVLSWRADSGLVLSVMELDRIKLATYIECSCSNCSEFCGGCGFSKVPCLFVAIFGIIFAKHKRSFNWGARAPHTFLISQDAETELNI